MKSKQVKVLIVDDTAEYGVKIAAQLREFGLYAYTRKKNGSVILESIKKDAPDIILTDVSLPDIDIVTLIHKTAVISSNKTKFIVTSPYADDFAEHQMIENDTSYFITKPLEIKKLCAVINSVARYISSEKNVDIEITVTNIIRRLGIPAHIKGYRYLRTAVLEVLEDVSLLDSITKKLYPLVASKHNTTASRVERSIRNAISKAWDRIDPCFLNSFFGYPVDSIYAKPSNSELIALIVDKIKLRCREPLDQFEFQDHV